MAAHFANAPFLAALQQILDHPTAGQQPDLLHFRVADAAAAAPPLRGTVAAATGGDSGGGGEAGDPAWMPLTAVLVATVVAAAAASRTDGGRLAVILVRHAGLIPARRRLRTLRRSLPHRVALSLHLAVAPLRRLLAWRRPARGLRLRAAIIVAVIPVALLASVAAAARHHRIAVPAVTDTGAGAPSSLSPAVRADLAVDTPANLSASAAPEWAQLVHVEQGITAQQDQLNAQEVQIGLLARVVANHRDEPDAPGPPAAHNGAFVAIENELASLVASHDAVEISYQASLRQEYSIYHTAAVDPVKRTRILAAVQAAPVPPAARHAVSYDLELATTQVQQEAAIADAERRLAQFGGLDARQIAAIRQGKPFIAPETGTVAQLFGPTDFSMEPPVLYNGTFYPHFHTGLDIDAPLDTPIHAAADGVVVLATSSLNSQGQLTGYGNYVVIAHPDGFITLYGHLDKLGVTAGQVVHQGEVIGLEGSTGWSTGPHVHFEVRHGTTMLDPAAYLAGQIPGLPDRPAH